MSSALEAAATVKKLQRLLRHIGASDGHMQTGSLRCDVNVSVSNAEHPLGTRCEVKNLNSIKSLCDAINFEVSRQKETLHKGETVQQDTRGFNEDNRTTFLLREKGDSPDYRFMPDPELSPLVIDKRVLKLLRKELPELPEQSYHRLQADYGITSRDSWILCTLGEKDNTSESSTAGLAIRYFEKCAIGRNGTVVANWIINDLMGQLSKHELPFSDNPLSPSDFGRFIDSVTSGQITRSSGKSRLDEYFAKGAQTLAILLEPSQVPGDDLSALCHQVVHDLVAESQKVRKGQAKVLMRLVGEVMKRSQGRLDAREVSMKLREIIDSTS